MFQAAFGEGSMQCARVNAKSASVHIKKGELDCALQLLQGAPPVLEVPLPYPALIAGCTSPLGFAGGTG